MRRRGMSRTEQISYLYKVTPAAIACLGMFHPEVPPRTLRRAMRMVGEATEREWDARLAGFPDPDIHLAAYDLGAYLVACAHDRTLAGYDRVREVAAMRGGLPGLGKRA